MDWGIAKVRGVADLHDVRPRRAGDGPQATLVARRRDAFETSDSPLLTMDGAVIGTPAYMPPEQAAGRVGEIDARSDVYAIGAMLYELLTGRAPYTTPGRRQSPLDVLAAVDEGPPAPVQELAPRHSAEIHAICGKAMARRPADRYASAVELAEDVQRYLDGRVVLAHRTGALIELRKWVGRNRAVAATAGAAAVVVVALTAWFVDSVRHERDVANDERDRASVAELEAAAQAVQAQAARAVAERARDEKAAALEQARALALADASALAEADDPMRALLLAREAARSTLRPEVVTRLRSAVRATREVRLLAGHDDDVLDVAVSPDGTRIATASTDGTALLWSRDGERLAAFTGHGSAVVSVAFAPDGRSVLTASTDGTARLWDLEGRALAVYAAPDDEVDDASFAPDGRRVVLLVGDGARVFEIDGRHVVSVHHGAMARAVRMLAGGALLVTVADDGQCVVWDMDGRRAASFAVGPTTKVRALDVAPDGSRIVTVDYDGATRLWGSDGTPLATLTTGRPRAMLLAAFSPDGSRIAAAGGVEVALWDAAGAPLASQTSASGDVTDLRWSPRGDRIVLATKSGHVDVRAADGALVAELRGHTDSVSAAVFVPGTELLVTGAHDGTARVWAPEGVAAAGGPAATLAGHANVVTSARFAPDGRRIVTASMDRTARVWDVGGAALAVLGEHEAPVTSACFSPDGTRVLTACAQMLRKDLPGSARLFDLEGHELARFDGHGYGITEANFRPDGQRVVTAGLDGVARIWELDGTEVGGLDLGHRNPLLTAVYTPDGTQLVTSSYHGELMLHDLDGTLRRTYRATPRVAIGRAVFAPDGTHFVAASVDNSAWMFALDRQESVRFRGHEAWVVSSVFSPDGAHVLTASQDGTARIWDLSGRQTDLIAGHEGPLLAAAYAPRGDLVVTAGADRVARVWVVGGAALLEQAERRVTREFTVAEREHYVDLLGAESRRLVGAHAYVEDLARRLVARGDVLRAVREDGTLDDAFRAAALEVARDLPVDQADWLFQDYWPVVAAPGRPADVYARAVRLAEAASRDEPWGVRYRFGLAVALCRVGAYERAVALLDALVTRLPPPEGSELPSGAADVHAFLALAHARLGRADAARRHLADARALLAAGGRRLSSVGVAEAFVAEAAAAVEAR